MMKKTLDSRDIYMYCDFHGHSRNRNLFIFGCKNDQVEKRRNKEKVFP
jgi:hypothetical protein